jgi:hypothetical protein
MWTMGRRRSGKISEDGCHVASKGFHHVEFHAKVQMDVFVHQSRREPIKEDGTILQRPASG